MQVLYRLRHVFGIMWSKRCDARQDLGPRKRKRSYNSHLHATLQTNSTNLYISKRTVFKFLYLFFAICPIVKSQLQDGESRHRHNTEPKTKQACPHDMICEDSLGPSKSYWATLNLSVWTESTLKSGAIGEIAP